MVKKLAISGRSRHEQKAWQGKQNKWSKSVKSGQPSVYLRLELSTISDGYGSLGPSAGCSLLLNFMNYIESLNDSTEHNMLSIERLSLGSRDKEL